MEQAIVDSGVILIKFWLEVSEEEQTRRLQDRVNDPRKIWKLSPMDLKSYSRWYDYSRARDDMFAATDSPHAPWYVVPSDDKRRARLNVIHHILKQVPYKAMPRREDQVPQAPEARRLSRCQATRTSTSRPCSEPYIVWGHVPILLTEPAAFEACALQAALRTYSLRFMTVQMSSLR